MRLSEDHKILLKVNDSDITHGTFIFPEEVTAINSNAFDECRALTQIVIPEKVTTIGNAIFQYCSALTQITIPERVTAIGDFVFYGCSRLKQITISDGVTTIGNAAFKHCSALTEITIPKKVTRISVGAFTLCSALTQITIPDGITTIERFAFYDCNNLHVIAVNTRDDLALERIKDLLPEEHRAKVIKNPFYAEVIKFQEAAYQSMPHNLRVSALVECYLLYQVTIPLAIYVLISGYETSVYQDFQTKAGRLPLPSTDAALQQYKHKFNDAFGLSLPEEQSQPQDINKDVLEPQLLCITQLRKYVDYINQKKEIKQKKHPAFFTENKTLLLEINNQLDAIEKTITFLKGGSESDIKFTHEDIAILGKGFIAKALGELIKSLPSDSSQQPGR